MVHTKTSGVTSSWPVPKRSTSLTIVPLTIWILLINTGLHAESFDVGSQGEVVIGVDIQLDAVVDEKCVGQDCSSSLDGFRIADLSLRYNHFENLNTNFFGEVSWDFSEDITTGFTTLESDLENVIRKIDPPSNGELDSDTLGVAFLGVRSGTSEIRLGRQKPESSHFSPTQTNYLNFSLSAFDDERVFGTGFSNGDMFSLASHRQDYSALIFFGVGRSDGSEPEMEYELYYDFQIKGMENTLITLATRSANWGSNRDSFKAHGIKLHIFQNNGNTYTAAISANDLGNYFEFVFSRDWAYRHRVQLGTSNFSSKPDNGFERLDSSPGSAQFYFANYTYAFSRYLNLFSEVGTYHESHDDSRNVALGLHYFF